MTDREAFHAAVAHEPGRILYYAHFTPDLLCRTRAHAGTEDLDLHYGFSPGADIGLPKAERPAAPDYSKYWAKETLPEGTEINDDGVAKAPAGFHHFFGFISPLRNAMSLREIEDYPAPDTDAWDRADLRQAVAAAHAAGRYSVGHVGHIYETAWQIRGYEPFLMDLYEQPAWAECLLDRQARINGARVRAYARAGLDMIRCGDDVANQNAMMFDPDLWRRIMLPRWRRIWEEGKSIHPDLRVWYHSDGNIEAIVPDLIEAGVDILNPMQPECLDIDGIHRRYGDRLAFDGCIGTQTTLPFGTPDEVRARVRAVIDAYGRQGGLIVSPTHVLEPDVPIANIDAFAAACREYGRVAASA